MIRNISDVLESVVHRKDLDKLETKLVSIEFLLKQLHVVQKRCDSMRKTKLKMLAEDVGGLRAIIARLNHRL